MAELDVLLQELVAADEAEDLNTLRTLREQIVEEHPTSEAAVEALYKIGLDLLFRERNLDGAVDKFVEAAKLKHPFWSAAARTSLALCYHRQKRTQKALLELRKVAYVEEPSSHSITALTFLETILQSDNNSSEAARVRKDRIAQLEKLLQVHQKDTNSSVRGFYMYQLAIALRDNGDAERSKKLLLEVKAMGPQALDAATFQAVSELLSRS